MCLPLTPSDGCFIPGSTPVEPILHSADYLNPPNNIRLSSLDTSPETIAKCPVDTDLPDHLQVLF